MILIIILVQAAVLSPTGSIRVMSPAFLPGQAGYLNWEVRLLMLVQPVHAIMSPQVIRYYFPGNSLLCLHR